MEWVLRSPQIHSAFSSLGFACADGYHVNENCNAALETILRNILMEDKFLRTYRRSISFGQNIKKDLIPLLINAKEDKTIELLIKILVNLTIPIECLLSLDVISKTDVGRHTIFEINNLLAAAKVALTDHRATKVVIEFLKKNFDVEQKTKLASEQCANISNTLLFLRNILHIPEDINNSLSPNYNGSHNVQNQILWNLFSQSIDKVLIKLMTIPDASNWAVTMVQLIALLYKDQHVTTLHKLLNLWLEAALSESSEDNESNTSPPDRGSDDSSPMLTSDPTSDSSDTGGSGKSNDDSKTVNSNWETSSRNINENDNQSFRSPRPIDEMQTEMCEHKKYNNIMNASENTLESNVLQDINCPKEVSERKEFQPANNNEKKNVISENSDCGYGTQIENQESISTSSNEDELPAKKPVHQKPQHPKQRINNKTRSSTTLQDRKRKKIVKRGKANIINVQGLSHNTPTDDDISNVLKEFTVDFLLKGYNTLVQTLHNQILTNVQLEIDTSHFFWLVTYFLKFATQIELDLEHVCSVLSFDIVSYLTAEGVNLCEQFELAIKLDGNDLKPCVRRLHLVVTAIRELVQAIEVYKKSAHITSDDQKILVKLQMKMCETEELRSLLVLLLRHYNPKYQSKQYLQDLVVTNHILLLFLDSIMKLPDYSGCGNMLDHIKQFASPEIMYQYGLLLEDYEGNGEFVNDCIFTLMHHVGGELDSLISLFQPKILKTFSALWKSDFEICDDWSDLIEYVINTFIKKPHTLQSSKTFRLDTESFDDIEKEPVNQDKPEGNETEVEACASKKPSSVKSGEDSRERWTDDEVSSLTWNYMQCNNLPDTIGEIVKLFKDDGISKARDSIVKELLKQSIISKEGFDQLIKVESDRNCKAVQLNKERRDDEIGKLCEQLTLDGKSKYLLWVQAVLLETCFAKICLEKKALSQVTNETQTVKELHATHFDLMKDKLNDLPVISSVSYHTIRLDKSVPLVPWNCEQAAICKDLKFLQLLHKLGFHMPVDTGKVFIRIPHFWTPDILYEFSGKIAPIDTSKLKFSLNDIPESSVLNSMKESSFVASVDITKTITMGTSENFYQIQKQKHLATIVKFTPMPGSSFNSLGDNVNKHNWLDVVQKSQEYKISMGLRSSMMVDDDNENVTEFTSCSTVTNVPVSMDIDTSPEVKVLPSVTLVSPSLLMPTIMSVKQEEANFSINPTETEYYNNSVCETASVASDLTRMYVSDEDEKCDVVIRPVMIKPPTEDSISSVSENYIAEKRPRIDLRKIRIR